MIHGSGNNIDQTIETDINNFDYVRQNFLDLQTQYNLFNYNNIDPYYKLINKNKSINNDFLEEYVKDFTKFDLQNCNFVETTVPKLYENKILTNSSDYSTRRLNALSPNEDLPEYYDNNDLLNDDYKEVDIKYNLNQLKYRNMDISYGQYMSTRGPDNAESGFHDWALPPDFSETKYKNSEKVRVNNDIEFHETDHLNNVDLKTGYKSTFKKENMENRTKFHFLTLSDIEFKQPNKTLVYTTVDKFNHYKGLSGLINNTIMNLPVERTLEYTSYLKQNDKPVANNIKQLGVSDTKTAKNKEFMSNGNNKMKYYDAHLRTNIKYALYDILHNDLNDKDIKPNRHGHKGQELQTLNLQQQENFKFGLKDNKEYFTIQKSPEYRQIRSVVENFLQQDTDEKIKKNLDIEYNNNYNKFNNKISPQNIMHDNVIYNIIKEEYSHLKDGDKQMNLPNHYNVANTVKSKYNQSKMQHSENRKFNYNEYMNNNDFKGKDLNKLQDGFVNRNKTIDESLYEESYDTNDNVELFTNLGNKPTTNTTHNNMSYSDKYRKNTFNDLSFGSFS
tara:strand:- start:433 stop:2112 length:1680 start_codon:yes stop_codon:yes gene_type:complete